MSSKTEHSVSLSPWPGRYPQNGTRLPHPDSGHLCTLKCTASKHAPSREASASDSELAHACAPWSAERVYRCVTQARTTCSHTAAWSSPHLQASKPADPVALPGHTSCLQASTQQTLCPVTQAAPQLGEARNDQQRQRGVRRAGFQLGGAAKLRRDIPGTDLPSAPCTRAEPRVLEESLLLRAST